MSSKSYSKTCLFWILLLLTLIALINRVVDPFWYYRDPQIVGFNSTKTEFHSYEKQIKPFVLKQSHPEVLIFGNSFFEIGLNPSHPSLTKNGSYHSYNFAMAASEWDKVYCHVLYAMDNTNLKTVIIGIAPGSLPIIDCIVQNNSLGKIELQTLLLSFDALRGSFNTLRHQHKPPTHTVDGLFFYHRNNSPQIEQVFKFYFDRYLKLSSSKSCSNITDVFPSAWTYPNNFEDLAGLRNILELLVSHNINVKLVVYPYHALWMELLMNCGETVQRWQSLYAIAMLVDEINQNHALIELWDFQGTSDMLTERIVNNKVKYWQDHGHFNYEMGDAMLDVIFNQRSVKSESSQDQFGVLLTKSSVVERFKSFIENRNNFVQRNPWFVDDLKKLTR